MVLVFRSGAGDTRQRKKKGVGEVWVISKLFQKKTFVSQADRVVFRPANAVPCRLAPFSLSPRPPSFPSPPNKIKSKIGEKKKRASIKKKKEKIKRKRKYPKAPQRKPLSPFSPFPPLARSLFCLLAHCFSPFSPFLLFVFELRASVSPQNMASGVPFTPYSPPHAHIPPEYSPLDCFFPSAVAKRGGTNQQIQVSVPWIKILRVVWQSLLGSDISDFSVHKSPYRHFYLANQPSIFTQISSEKSTDLSAISKL